MTTDLATVVARFGAALRDAGLPVGPDRCERFAHAICLIEPHTTRELHRCGLATLVAGPEQRATFDAVFAAVFGGLTDPTGGQRGDRTAPAVPELPADRTSRRKRPPDAHNDGGADRQSAPLREVASARERLAGRDFADLSPDELLRLARLMRDLRLVTPPRRTRRHRATPLGHRVDLRATLGRARQTGGDPVRIARRTRSERPRRLVVLCDISGSMEPYARAMLQLLYCAAGGARAEVFTFATRLTRLTRELTASQPAVALARAGQTAPDWSGGTRIGATLRDFNDRYGSRGMARGSVVLIVSDGWETGDPGLLEQQMERLSRMAYRIVWGNPRLAGTDYRPLVGGMAAAWPYCDAIVAIHNFAALSELLQVLAEPVRTDRYSIRRAAPWS